MKIGKLTFDGCEKCVFRDEDYGCTLGDEIEVEIVDGEDVVCKSGMEISTKED